jgi:polyketide biosynthesis 3-hydroxy-3-methylglutaryl-CoA synthase-like enzyme PksG
MRQVGIEAVNAYVGLACVGTRALFAARGLDDRRVGNLMMEAKTVALPCEDVVTYAVNAASPLLDRLEPGGRHSIEILLVATESGIDYSKSAAAWVHGLLALSPRCRIMEVKQACDSGISAVRMAASALRTDHEAGARALVVAADVPWVLRGDYIEPSQGAGAVAVLVGDTAAVASLEPAVGVHTFDAPDFLRPRPDVYLWDVDLSMMCYLECAKGALADYARVTGRPGAFERFDYLAMHTPFPGMVRGVHRTLARVGGERSPGAVSADFARRVAPALRHPARVGNIYAATTLLALVSVVDRAVDDEAYSVGVFSYGSGCSSQWCALTVTPGARDHTGTTATALDARRTLDVAAYDRLLDAVEGTEGGARERHVDLAALKDLTSAHPRPLLALSGISGYRRTYTWLEG